MKPVREMRASRLLRPSFIRAVHCLSRNDPQDQRVQYLREEERERKRERERKLVMTPHHKIGETLLRTSAEPSNEDTRVRSFLCDDAEKRNVGSPRAPSREMKKWRNVCKHARDEHGRRKYHDAGRVVRVPGIPAGSSRVCHSSDSSFLRAPQTSSSSSSRSSCMHLTGSPR